MSLLLSPHNDDEGLFAAYVCLREKPKVVTLLNGARKRHYPTPAARADESAAAMKVLGCEFEHLGFPIDDGPLRWDVIAERLADAAPDRVWAPLPEPAGNGHHNRTARLAHELWPGRVAWYSTYTTNGDGFPTRSTHGERVPVAPGWPTLKRRALRCYRSQSEAPPTAMHFKEPLDEYVVDELKLNLGGGLNPLPGFVNLDKSDGWMFEDGLGCYPSGSVAAVTVSHTLMYVPLDRWPFCFAEMARVLRPGGVLRVTEDAIGAPGSSRPVIRPHAEVATTVDLVHRHMDAAGLAAGVVSEAVSGWRDGSLIQSNYGHEPDVFHMEGVKPR